MADKRLQKRLNFHWKRWIGCMMRRGRRKGHPRIQVQSKKKEPSEKEEE